MAFEDAIEIIKAAKSVVILPHINADGDAIASCKAMAEALYLLDKKCVIYSEEPVEPRLSFLSDGVMVYDGIPASYDLCLALDCGDLNRIGERRTLLESADHVINIDHHKTNTMFGEVNIVDAKACATGEILVSVIDEMGIDFTKDIARYLYVAICSDSGCFKYSSVTADTMRRTARLLDTGFDHSEITHILFDESPLNVELMRADITQNIHSYEGGRLRIVTADESLAKKYDLKNDEIQGLVEIPRKIQGTEIAVAIKDIDGKITASFRSNNDIDVAEISIIFGGGGHSKAAGCRMHTDSLEEAEKMIVAECEKALDKKQTVYP